jgi:DNA/RNA-binding domain of Phe-tRNA-synthetase-like protein
VADEVELTAAPGFIDPAVRQELPGLRLAWVMLEARPRASSGAIRQRLRVLSNRYRGDSVVALRTQPVPHAYRVFFRQVGLDPDTVRIPGEEVAVARLLHGGLRSEGLPADALLIALVETGIPVWALDADRIDPGGLGIRLTADGEPFGSETYRLPAGRLVVADARSVHGLLFGEIAPGHGVTRATSRMALFAVGVEGVPDIHLEEALWIAGDTLAAR